MKRKALSLVLALCMVLTLLPVTALAAGTECAGGADCQHAAAIGSTHYDTLTAAAADAVSGQTIELLKNIADAGNVTLKAGVTLDGKSNKLTGRRYGAECCV